MDNSYLHLKWYIYPLFSFIFTLTFWENLWLFLVIVFSFIGIYLIFSYKEKNLFYVNLVFGISSLSLLSYFLFNYTYYKNSFYSKTFVIKKFKIIDSYKKSQYILEDDFGNSFIGKNFKKTYKLGDIIKVYGYLVPVSGDFNNWWYNFTSFNPSPKQLGKFDYNMFLKMKQFHGIVYVKYSYFKTNEADIFLKLKQDFLDKISQLYINYPDKYKALVAGLLIGDKSFLEQDVYKKFIDSGLVHIIVVSGGNMVFLIIFLSFIFFFVPFYLRLLIIGLFLVGYAVLVGGDSSVIRALIMGLLGLLALFFGQNVSTYRLLGFAFIFMVLYNPYFLIYDLGFILSFVAIIGILFFNKFRYKIGNDYFIPNFIYYKTTFKEFKKLTYTSWKEKFKYLSMLSILKTYNNYILPTLGASIFTAPFILFFTGKVNLLNFLASIVVIPFVPILMFSNLIAVFLAYLNTNLAYYIISLNIPLLKWIFYVSTIVSEKISIFINM